MTVVALCAVFLALVVQAPFIAILVGPLIASVLEVRKGGSGLTGGLIGGVITWVGLGLFFLMWEWYTDPFIRLTADVIVWVWIALAGYTISGVVIGLAEGVAFCYVRYLGTLPKILRLRAERSARANSVGSRTAGRKAP
jgi:hypothetical protein